MKQSISIVILITIWCTALTCMEPKGTFNSASALAQTQPQTCSWCQEAMEPIQILRKLPCNHTLHIACYKTWCHEAKHNKTDILCAVCRHPVKYYKIEFTPDEIQQRVSLLTIASDQIRLISDTPTKLLYLRISQLLKNEHLCQESRTLILNMFLGYLEDMQITPRISEVIAQRDSLDEQVNHLLEQHTDDQARLHALQIPHAPEAFAFLDAQFKRKNAATEKLEEENKELREKVSKIKKKSGIQKQIIYAQSEKLKAGYITLKALQNQLNFKRIGYSLITIGAISYGAHRFARYKAPESDLLDLGLTIPATVLTTLYCIARCASHARQEKKLLNHLKS